MIGYSDIFKSRWATLLWALGICLTVFASFGFGTINDPAPNGAAQANATGANSTDADANATGSAPATM